MVSTVRADNDAPLVNVYDIESSKLVESYEVRTTRPSSTSTGLGTAEQEVIKTKAELIAGLSAETEMASDMDSSEAQPIPSVLTLMVGQAFASLVPAPPEEGLLSAPERASSVHPGWMVIAGDDRVVRYWDLVKTSDSFVVCGSQKDRDVSFRQATPSDRQLMWTELINQTSNERQRTVLHDTKHP
jgi:phosphoinositide-3-kinase regulatory subunit 4